MQGHLTEAQEAVLRDVVQDQVVYDLGAGSCDLAYQLRDMGASKVIAIDRNPAPIDTDGPVRKHPKRLEYRQAYFHDLEPITEGVVFLSWPQQYLRSLVGLVKDAPTVVYLGCNTDMSACGPIDFWIHVSWRELKHHVPNRRNTLLVYGEEVGPRKLVLEEVAGMDRTVVYNYKEQDND